MYKMKYLFIAVNGINFSVRYCFLNHLNVKQNNHYELSYVLNKNTMLLFDSNITGHDL